jgi:hypothetical protein
VGKLERVRVVNIQPTDSYFVYLKWTMEFEYDFFVFEFFKQISLIYSSANGMLNISYKIEVHGNRLKHCNYIQIYAYKKERKLSAIKLFIN